jgi:hypothetical protein
LLTFLVPSFNHVAPFLDFTLHISFSPFLFVQTVFYPHTRMFTPHASDWLCSFPICLTFSPYSLWLWGQSQHVLPKHWYPCMRLHFVITQVKIWINTTMKTWKLPT